MLKKIARHSASLRQAVRWRTALFSVGLCAGVLLFVRQVWSSYIAIRQQELILYRPTYLLAGGVAILLFYGLQVMAWGSIMRCLGTSLDPRQAFKGYFLSFLPRYIPGSVWGYWSRSHWLEQNYGVRYTTSVLGSVLEALALTLTGIGVAGFCASIRWEGALRFAAVGAWVGAIGMAWLGLPKLVVWFGRRFRKGVSPPHQEGSLLKTWSLTVVLYLLLWTTYGTSIFLTASTLTSASATDLLGTVFVSSLSWVAGFAAVIVPAGIGVREVTFATLLPLHTGFLSWQAHLIAVLSRVEVLLAELAFLAIGLGLHFHALTMGSEDSFPKTDK